MVRQSRWLARVLVAAALATSLVAGCGIKGPLVSATAADAAKDATKDKPSDRETAKKP